MKITFALIVLLASASVFAADTYKCTAESKAVFGDYTLVLEKEVGDAPTNPTEPPEKSGTMDIYLAFNDKTPENEEKTYAANAKLNAYCFKGPESDQQIVCIGTQKDGDNEAPVIFTMINKDTLKGEATAGDDQRFQYTCEKQKEEKKDGEPK